ncbi:MAG: acetate--CoA ligase family protein [Candidatus Hodarchaeales archaeon]
MNQTNHFLEELVNPKSVAILGASNNPMTMGTGQLYVLKSRFKGNIFPIHPVEETVQGLPAFRSIEDMPSVPDLLIIVLPTRLVTQYLEQAGKFGITNVIIVSAGFSEVGKVKEQEQLNLIAKKYDMRFIGPNCIGIVNCHDHDNCGIFNCTWFPFELPEGLKGNISLTSQSGSWVSQILIWAERRGLKIGKAISVGNEANVNVTDCLEYFVDDPDTEVVGMYIEGIKNDGRRFVKALEELIKKKPVVVNYSGGTLAGSRAGLSHTASLGGSPRVYDAVFQQAGAIRANSIEELYEFLHAFSMTHPPKGNRIGLITNSGGPAVSLADNCEKNDLPVPKFSNKLQENLNNIIPAVASSNNPIDLTFDVDFNLFYDKVPRLVWNSGEVDALIMYGIFGPSSMHRMVKFAGQEQEELFLIDLMSEMLTGELKEFVNWVHQEKVPLMISCLDTGDNVVNYLQKNNVAVFKFPSMTVKAMKALIDYYDARKMEIEIGQ